MQFFLYEIVARVVAIYLCVDCYRNLRNGLIERKIESFKYDWLDWLLDWTNWVFHRDTQPFRYWLQMSIEAMMLLCCLVVAVFGWWRPES